MRAALIFPVGLFALLGGCILSSEYDYDGYAETGGSSASSSGPGGPGGSGPAPPVEVCGNGKDDDGDGISCDGHPANWEGRFGDSEDQRVLSVALSASGAMVVAGEFNGTFDLGSGKTVVDTAGLPSMPSNPFQPFIAKFDPTGKPIWMFDAGVMAQGRYTATAMSGEKAFVVGYIQSDTSPPQALVAKVDPNLDQSWQTNFGILQGSSRAASLAVTPDGLSVYVAGTVGGSGMLQFPCGSEMYNGTTGENRLFVAKLDADGNCAWAKVYEGGDFIFDTISIGIAKTGDLVISGSYKSAPIGTSWPSLPAGSAQALFVAEASVDTGELKASKGYAAADGNVNATSMAVDPSTGMIYMTGSFDGTFQTNLGLTGDPTSTANDPSTDAFVMAIEPTSLDVSWIDRFGGLGRQVGSSISAAAGGVFVAGITDTPMTVDPPSETGRICLDGGTCMFLMKLHESGRPEWAESFGSGGADKSTVRIAAGSSAGGGVDLALGVTWNEPDFSFEKPPVSHPLGGGLDVLVAKVPKIP